MKRRDILIAKLRAKQKIRQVMEAHTRDFAPPQPQPQQEAQPQPQEMQNARTTPSLPETDQPV